MARIMRDGKVSDTSKTPLKPHSLVTKAAVKKVRKAAAKKVRNRSNADLVKRTPSHNLNMKINQWSEENMRMAIEQCDTSNITIRAAARAWQVPRSTLQLRVKGKVMGNKHSSGRKPLLSAAAEEDLVSIIKLMAQRGFPLGMKEVRSIAYQYAVENGIPGFSESKHLAGYDWFNGFANRHPDIGMRKPEPLSLARASGMNRPVIQKWFDALSADMSSAGILDNPSHLWNVDETGLQDYFIPTKVVGETSKPCYQSTATERGQTTTAIAAFNAVGRYVQTMVIFRGKRFKQEWAEAVPKDLDVIIRMSDKGWITTDLFLAWGKSFVAQLPKDDPLPHILFLDGHGSHVYNLQFLNLMQENNVRVWCFPPHTTHWLQPADRSLFRSLKHNWVQEGLHFSRTNGGCKLSRGDFLKVLGAAWKKSASVENALSGFTATGLFPFNPKKIPDEAFLPSLTSGLLLRTYSLHRPRFGYPLLTS
jgi:hypothetical protein